MDPPSMDRLYVHSRRNVSKTEVVISRFKELCLFNGQNRTCLQITREQERDWHVPPFVLLVCVASRLANHRYCWLDFASSFFYFGGKPYIIMIMLKRIWSFYFKVNSFWFQLFLADELLLKERKLIKYWEEFETGFGKFRKRKHHCLILSRLEVALFMKWFQENSHGTSQQDHSLS